LNASTTAYWFKAPSSFFSRGKCPNSYETSFFLLSLLFVAVGRPVAAQDLTNNGGLLSLANGAVLCVPGTMTNAAGSTLGLGTGGQLTVGGNFVNGGTLVPGTGAVLLVGPAAQTLDLGGATLYDLTVNNPAARPAVTLPTSLVVTHRLTLASGLVRTVPTATLTLPDGAALIGETTARYVAGNLRAERAADRAALLSVQARLAGAAPAPDAQARK